MTSQGNEALLDLIGVAVLFVAISVLFTNQRLVVKDRSWQLLASTICAAIACLLISARFVLSYFGH
jgi:hypothetical protein